MFLKSGNSQSVDIKEQKYTVVNLYMWKIQLLTNHHYKVFECPKIKNML